MSFLTRTAPSPQEMAREAYIKKNITVTLGLALKTLQQKHVNSEEPIYSEDSANTVCNILEAVFLHGLKASFSHKKKDFKLSSYLIGVDPSKTPQPSFWELLTRFSHKDVLSQLNHLGQITTEIGMCRAWLRVALNDGLLESYLDAMIADKGSVRYFYKRTAYLRDEEQAGILKSYSQGIQNFRFQLSYNSSVLNIWTTTPLVLAGLLEQTVTPRAAMPSSQSEGAISQLSAASSAEEEVMVRGHRVHQSRPSEPVIVSSRSYTSGLRHAAASPPTPPNTPYNPATLSRTDIEEIRKLSEQTRTAGSASTPPSQISCPDYVTDGRFATPSLDGASSESLRVPSRSPSTGRRKVRSQGGTSIDISIEEEGEESGTPNKDREVTMAIAEEGAGASSATEHLPDTGLTDVQDKDKESDMEVTDQVVPVTEQVQEETVQDTQPDSSDTTKQPEEGDKIARVKQAGRRSTIQPIAEGAARSAASRPPPPPLLKRKSDPLLPVLTEATARVEVAREMSPTTMLSSSSEETTQAQGEVQDVGIYDKYGPSPQGNKLGSMQGWSSEFQEPEVPFGQVKEEAPAPVGLHREQSVQEDYNTLLQDYTPRPVHRHSMSQVLEDLDNQPASGTISPEPPSMEPEPEDEDYPEDYDVVPLGLNVTSEQADSRSKLKNYSDKRTQQLVSIIGEICNEKGLDQQNYQCNGCSRPIGMIYGKARVCTYDGCYYCYECHENEVSVIPSHIVHNWDFSKQEVARHTVRFLQQIEEDPLLNIQHINPRLYDHVPEMKEVREVRTQLRFLKAYLFTCKQSVADDLRKQVWPKEYLYDDIHLYSLQDLLQITSGQLVASLRKVIKFAARHVYDCRLCSQKGFICEVCNNPKVIYPFEAESTWRCERCNAVYHKDCRPTSGACVKCERRRTRQMSIGDIGDQGTVDYAYVPE